MLLETCAIAFRDGEATSVAATPLEENLSTKLLTLLVSVVVKVKDFSMS